MDILPKIKSVLKKKSDTLKVEDILPNSKNKILSLKKRIIQITIDVSKIKDFFNDHKKNFYIIGGFIASLVVILFAFNIKAEILKTNLYPDVCLGGWQNPKNAQGIPDVKDGDANFSEENSAYILNSSGQIFCGNFHGTIPNDVKPKKFFVKLSLLVTDKKIEADKPIIVPSNDPTLLDTVTPVVDTKTESPIDTTTGDQTQPVEPTPTTDVTPPAPSDQPVSFLRNVTPVVYAEDTIPQDIAPDTTTPDTTTTVDTTPTETTTTTDQSTPPPPTTEVQSIDIPNTDLLEIDYTVDGTEWKKLATVSKTNWQNNQFELQDEKILSFEDLSKVQISIKTLPTIDSTPVVYLDGMSIEVQYEKIDTKEDLPKILVTDNPGVDVITGGTNFSSTDSPDFIISDPNLDTTTITNLLKDNKAQVVEDKNNIFSEPPPAEPITTPIDTIKNILNQPSDGTHPQLDQIKDIINPPADANVIDLDKIQKVIEAPKDVVSFLFSTPIAYAEKIAQITEAKVLDGHGRATTIATEVTTVLVDGVYKQKVKVIRPSTQFVPGKYTLSVSIETPNAIIVSQQDFTWGVLSINVNKSVYETGEDAYLQMGVLTNQGHTICSANLGLTITSPNGTVANFSTNNHSIVSEPQCGPDNVISVPDYYAHFPIPNEAGTYTMVLTALTANGTRTITDTFLVVQNANFSVERVGPTRIFPYSNYPMQIKVTAKNNWQGVVSEYAPTSFGILAGEQGQSFDSVETVDDPNTTSGHIKKISWNVSLTAGQETTLGYIFDAPDISPEYYILGKAQLVESNNNISFEESRNWQIASDATCTMTTGTWNGLANTNNVGNVTGTAVWSGCTGGAGFSPTTGDTIQVNSSITLTITGSGTVGGIIMNTPTVANALIINDTFTLTDSGALTFNTNATAVNSLVTLGSSTGAGNLTVGSISMAAPTGGVASIEKINCSTSGTGTLTISGTGAIGITGSSTASNTGSASIDMTAGACNVITGTGTNTLTAGTTGATPNAFIRMGTGTITFNSSLTFAGATASKDALITANGTTISLNNATLPAIGTPGSYTITSATNLVSAGTSAVSYATAVSTWGTLTVNSGTLTLSAAAETFTGAVNIAGGTLSLGNTFTASSTTSVTGTISNLNSAAVKTFTGLVTVHSGGSVNLTTATVPVVVIGAGVTTETGAGTVNFGTGTTTFSASPTFTGPVNITIGSSTVASAQTLTNNMSATLTLGALTLASPTAANNVTLAAGSTTTVSGALTFTANTTANNQTITITDTAILNVTGNLVMNNVPTSTGGYKIVCSASSTTGKLQVTGTTSIGVAATAVAGAGSIDMSNCSSGLFSTGALTLTGNATGTGIATVKTATGTITANSTVTFATAAAKTLLSVTGAGTLNLNGTVSATGTVTMAATSTTNMNATLSLNGGYTWGKVNVVAGTTTLGAATTFAGDLSISSSAILKFASFAFTESGATSISGAINCNAALSCTSTKTFTGAVTVNSGGSFDLNTGTPTVAPATSFGNNITVSSGATAFNTGIATSTTFFTANSILSGSVAMTFAGTGANAVTINSGVTVTNSSTSTVTFGVLTLASGATGISLTTGSTTTVTGALTFAANATATNTTITMNGTANLNAGSVVSSASTSTGLVTIVGASGATGTLTVSGTTTLVGSGIASSNGAIIDFATNATTCTFTTNALVVTAGIVSPAKVLMGTGTFTANGLVTLTGAASGTALAQLLSTTTGTLDLNAGLTMAGTVIANANLTGGSGGTIQLTGTMAGLGTLSISGVTFQTTGTTTIGAAYTLPNLNVLAGTTSMGGFAISITGPTNISGTLNTSSATGTKTFGSGVTNGLVTVNSGGTFNFSAFATPLTFYSGITMASGATAFTMLTTNAVAFGSGLGNAQTISGDVNMTFGAVSMGNSEILTNSSTATVTMQSLAIPTTGAIANGLSLSDLSTTTVTGAITMAANSGTQAESITMNGSANLNAGSMSVAASTTAFDNGVVCNGGTGTLTVTGALGITAGTIAGGDSLLAMDTCTLTANGLVTITGGTNGIASISGSTGVIDMNAGITFTGTTAQARINTSGTENIYITGTITGVGILTGVNSATTIHTQGTSTIGAAIVLPNLTVDSGTTSVTANAVVSTGGLTVANGAVLQFTGTTFNSSGTTTVNGTIRCTAAATCTGIKTFTGAITVNSGGAFDLNVGTPTVFAPLVFGGDITVNTGGTFNTGITTTTNTFSGNSTLSGGGAMTFAGTSANATTINSGVLVTNSNTNTVTFGVLTLASGATGLSLSDLSTTTVTGLLSMAANATATNTNIAMNGTADLNAGTFTITPPTSTGNAGVTCNAGSGTFTVTGVTTISGNATSTGTTNMLMDSCSFSSGGAVNMGGGANAVGGIDTLSFSTGTLTLLTGINFAGVSQARNRLTTTGAGTINLTGTMSGGGTISIDPTTTFNTTGTAALNSPVTLPNLNVLTGTTSMGGVAVTVSGSTTIAGSVVGSSSAGTKTFTGPVTVNPGGSFDLSASGTFVVVNSFAGGITTDGTAFNTSAGATSFTNSQSLAGSGPIVFGGAVTISNTFTLTNSNTNTVNFNAAINGGGSSANFSTDINSTTNFGTTVMTTGTLTPSTSPNTIAYDGGTQTIKAPTTNPYYNLNITTAGVKSLAAITTVTNTIDISAGTLDTTSASHYNINTGNMTIGGSGTLLGQAATITLTGNWSSSGTFTAGTSTVLFNGATTASISGTTTFNNLTITDTGPKEVDFDSTGITHVTGIFTVTGHSGNLITLRSLSSPTQWQIHPTGTASVNYADVMDGGCQTGSINISPTNFTNSGNNDNCWVPTSITFANDDSSIGFGTLSTSAVCYATSDSLGSGTDAVAHTFSIATNAPSGYTLTYFGSTLASGGGTVSPATNIGTGGTTGQSQFAISGTLTGSGTMTSGYDHATPLWSFAHNTTTTLASSTGPAPADTIDMHYQANIDPTTPAGDYTTTITYILTGNF